ncbi:hypothetical protein BHM03_00003873 [Ensete ventricosum]|uniref:Uncharacterized protein n=1 Tax=Ensete ventricosum TaxID=4639 RepID=A0A426YPC5_ENSVE|nr:hypothetical protein B296_00030835 [Ensete ventricosum]RZR71150.1 hypothetical protein BHM03_00003873 [Ensete ventricosum]
MQGVREEGGVGNEATGDEERSPTLEGGRGKRETVGRRRKQSPSRSMGLHETQETGGKCLPSFAFRILKLYNNHES